MLLFYPACGRWQCDTCALGNRQHWRYVGRYGAQKLIDAGMSLQFCLVTSNAKLRTAEATIHVFKDVWPKLLRRLKRVTPKLIYLGVPEQHEDGRLHFHFVANTQIEHAWLKRNAIECGAGWFAGVKPVSDAAGVARYVTKYVTKQLTTHDWPRGFRRIRKTTSWPMPPKWTNPAWTFMLAPAHEPLLSVQDRLEQRGFDARICTDLEAWRIIDSMA